MNNSTRKKREQLGMNPSTAAAILRKSLLFKMAQYIGDDYCYQCGERINSVDDFSVEHKKPWLDSDDPVGLFFDLDNVAFSHLTCNIKAARQTRSMKHPSPQMYNKGCRCGGCTEENTLKARNYRSKIK